MVLPLMLSGGGRGAGCYVASAWMGDKFDRVPDCSALVGVLLLSRVVLPPHAVYRRLGMSDRGGVGVLASVGK